ncbi:hypothetical protein HC891_23065 [Candidatus Gracilibacteria bacterium]|nr:hypothetical protein [Candidatus Gracilibacteria bacterium]
MLDDLYTHVAGVDPATVAPNPLARSAAASPPAADPAAPRTISHALGETEVVANPQSIVVVGYNEEVPYGRWNEGSALAANLIL